jgi:hypothetical protein
MPDLTTIITCIGTLVALASLVIQHRRTPKLPEPSIKPVSVTILGADMNRSVGNLPTYDPNKASPPINRNNR